MGARTRKELPALYEVIPCADVTATTIARIDRLPGDLYRFVLAIDQTLEDGTSARIVVAKVIWPLCALPAAMQQLALIIADKPMMADMGVVAPMTFS